MPWTTTALYLPLHVAGVDGPPCVLQRRVPQDGHLPGVRIDLNVDDVQSEGVAHAAGVDRSAAYNGAPSAVQPGRQGLEGDAQLGVLPVGQDTLLYSTSSGETSQMRAARSIICCLMSWAASWQAVPILKVTPLPAGARAVAD